MSANILVATPQTPVGELLRFNLEESSKYRVRLAQSGREALAAAGRIKFDLAILDALLSDQPLPVLAAALIEHNPGIRLVVIPTENNNTPLILNGQAPDATLNLPFYTPDLFEMMDRLLAAPAESLSPESPRAPVQAPARTLGDPRQASELIDTLLKQGSGKQALVMRDRQLWCSAGSLEKKHQQELAEVLNRSWEPLAPGDVARFIRLADGGGEVMLYATPLAPDSVLAVIFDSAAPLTRIRGQVNKLAQALRAYFNQIEISKSPAIQATESQPTEIPPGAELAAPSIPEPQPQLIEQQPSEELIDLFSAQAPTGQAADDLLIALQNESSSPPSAIPASPVAAEKPSSAGIEAGDSVNDQSDEENGVESEMPEISLSDLLAAMPSPDPEERSLSTGIEWFSEGEESEQAGDEFLFPWERISPQPAAWPLEIEDTQPIRTRAADSSQEIATVNPAVEPALPGWEPEPGEGSTEKIQRAAAAAQPAAQESSQNGPVEPALPDPVEGLPPILDAVQIRNKLEDIEASAAEFACLTYTCLMIPAVPGTTLSGSLADRLGEWLTEVCFTYGWRLIDQSIHAETFQWTVQVSQVVSPGNIVRLVRLQTSQRILEAFGKAAGFTEAGQFWAPGYLIISGSTPPEESLVQNFVEQSRKRMGTQK